MKKYAVAYTNLFENSAHAIIIEAENKNKAISFAILKHIRDEETKKWLSEIVNLDFKQFVLECANCDLLVDAEEICNF